MDTLKSRTPRIEPCGTFAEHREGLRPHVVDSDGHVTIGKEGGQDRYQLRAGALPGKDTKAVLKTEAVKGLRIINRGGGRNRA